MRLNIQADEEANALLVQAAEVYEMAKRIEDLKGHHDPLCHPQGEGGGEGHVGASRRSSSRAGGDE